MEKIVTRKEVAEKLQEYVDYKITIADLQEWELNCRKEGGDFEDKDEKGDSFICEVVHHYIDFSDIDGFEREEAQKAIELLNSKKSSTKLIKEYDEFIIHYRNTTAYERNKSKITCACCGYKTLDERDHYEICPICFWEDDLVQEGCPDWLGANNVSLRLAQENFRKFQASGRRARLFVRPPNGRDAIDEEFKPLPRKEINLLKRYRDLRYPEPIITNEYNQLSKIMNFESVLVSSVYGLIHQRDSYETSRQYYTHSVVMEWISSIRNGLNEFNDLLNEVKKMDLDNPDYPDRKARIIQYFEGVQKWAERFVEEFNEKDI